MAQKYSQQFRQACSSEAQRIAAKIGRPLFAQEERGIKNIGSIMLMESALSDIYEAESMEELEVALSTLASDTRRLEVAIGELDDMLIETFELTLSNAERGLLMAKSNGLDIIIAKEELIEISKTLMFRKNKAKRLMEDLFDAVGRRK